MYYVLITISSKIPQALVLEQYVIFLPYLRIKETKDSICYPVIQTQALKVRNTQTQGVALCLNPKPKPQP